MPYTLAHRYTTVHAPVTITDDGESATVRCSVSGSFEVHFPGELLPSKFVRYTERTETTNPNGSGKKQVETVTKTLPLKAEIRKPNGALFTAGRVTLDEFRDLRGTSHGVWTFKLTGESKPIALKDPRTTVLPQKNTVSVIGIETVASRSAAARVTDQLPPAVGKRYTFDLFRSCNTYYPKALPRFAITACSALVIAPSQTNSAYGWSPLIPALIYVRLKLNRPQVALPSSRLLARPVASPCACSRASLPIGVGHLRQVRLLPRLSNTPVQPGVGHWPNVTGLVRPALSRAAS